MLKKYKITYSESITKTSIVIAEDEPDAYERFEDNGDVERKTIASYREVDFIEEVKEKE